MFLIPIMFTSFLSGFLFGNLNGFIFSILGYLLASLFYYYLGRYFHNIDFVKRKIVLIKTRYRKLFNDINIITVSFLAITIPFMLLAPFLGVLKKRKRVVILGLVLGALPAIFFSVNAGSSGMEFIKTRDSTLLMYSIGYLILMYMINKFLIKKYKRKYE